MSSPRNVHSDEDRSTWVEVQKKTFLRWLNSYVPPDSKANGLSDLADGTILAGLLGSISEESVGRINKKPKIDIQKLENLNQCLKFIQDHDIPLVNIGSSDILHGNEKLILGLLWTIILRFEVSGADGKQGLLLWLQRSTKGYNGVDVRDFTSSWKDGLAFNALIHRYRPDLVDFNSLQASNALENCRNAFDVTEEKLGIARLLDPEDVVAQPDEKSQVAYLSQFFKLFASQAKLESRLRAIKNAVEVTRRHDEWIQAYESGSAGVQQFVEATKTKLGGQGEAAAPATTEEVKKALDEFSRYMKEEKPGMASVRAETEGIYTTLVSSKRNNERPEFQPQISPEQMNAAWESLEEAEQKYERQMLDRYLNYQKADHAVSKFNARSKTVKTWIEEKLAVFQAGVQGSSVPALEAELEIHTSYKNRMALYEPIVQELQLLVDKAGAVHGHADVAQAVLGIQDLSAQMEACKQKGTQHEGALNSALQTERTLVEKEKHYLHKIEDLDFKVDQLEEQANEDVQGARAAQMQELKDSLSSFAQDISNAQAVLAEVSQLANEISSKRPDAPEHCQQQQSRLTELQSQIETRDARATEVLAEEQRKDELSKKFAQLANDFAQYCENTRNELGALSGSLEDQRNAIAGLRSQVSGENSNGACRLDALRQISSECDVAQIVANPYTTHTVYSLSSEYEQLLKAIKRADDAISAQLMAQKSLEIPPEQLKEIQEIFHVFDQDQDGKLRLSDLREACLGAGIDLEGDELEKRMKARSSNMLFTLDDFIAFFIDEVKTGDSKADVIEAFKAISSTGTISREQVQQTFGSINPDLAEYISSSIGESGEFVAFTEQLFTR